MEIDVVSKDGDSVSVVLKNVRVRSAFHLSALEATCIKTLKGHSMSSDPGHYIHPLGLFSNLAC